MHGHVNKRVKMHRKPTGGTNKNDKHKIAQSGKGKGVRGATGHHEDASQAVTSKQGLMSVGCNQTRSSLRREQSMAKPRTREANIEHKT